MKSDKYAVTGEKKIDIRKLPTNAKKDGVDKDEIIAEYEAKKAEIALLQDKFYADGREGIIIVLQALDASGKDSAVKNIFSGMNPQGIKIHSFKAPNSEELCHDYLWRIHQNVPRRGEIAVFNRSHYEDLITVQVENIKPHYHMSDRIIGKDDKTFFKERYEQVNNLEEYLYHNGYKVIKIFLLVSKDEQARQLLERIDIPEKNWKFRADDIRVRAKFDEYVKCFNDVVNKTDTMNSPWYVLPGDQRWYTRYLITEILLDALKSAKSEYPPLPEEDKEQMKECRAQLLAYIEEKDEEKETPKKKSKKNK